MTNQHGGTRPGAGRPRTQGERHNVKLPAHVWEWLDQQGASHTITKLVEDKMSWIERQEKQIKASNRISEMDFTSAQVEFILTDWNDPDHMDWLLTASREEIASWGEAADWGVDPDAELGKF
jgi:hypothetical protein